MKANEGKQVLDTLVNEEYDKEQANSARTIQKANSEIEAA